MILTGASNLYIQSYIEVQNTATFLRYFVQDCLLRAQRALAVLYEDRYPCTNWVQRGLRELLYQRCNGSRHEFNDNFLRPTIALLEKLKEQVKYLKSNLVERLCWRPWRTYMHGRHGTIDINFVGFLAISLLHFSGTAKYFMYRSVYFSNCLHRAYPFFRLSSQVSGNITT